MRKLLIVGNRGGSNIGESFERAAAQVGMETHLMEAKYALSPSPWVQRWHWWLCGRRPARLRSFSQQVADFAYRWKPDCLIATGIIPLDDLAMRALKKLGVRLLNYLTDDPWSYTHYSSWFIKALSLYDDVFSVRRANMPDLAKLRAGKVHYLPFAYDPNIFFPEPPSSDQERKQLESDVFFAGGADKERAQYFKALIRDGICVGLYGDYWNRYREVRSSWRGYADPATIRRATACCKISLSLVRKSNRDGNSMRSFENPAMRACCLMEDTLEHREIFGSNGRAVLYFNSTEEMIEQSRWLIKNPIKRQELADSAYELITHGRHTYKDRLIHMLSLTGQITQMELERVK
jgi:spore maturation protein CgeB